MLFHILKKDLKRKRTMNVIILLFIILASMFLASSVSNMITITGAVDYFLEKAETPDYVIIAASENRETEIDTFLKKCGLVTEYEVQELYTILSDDIEIVKSREGEENRKYDKGNTLSIASVPDTFAKIFDDKGNDIILHKGELAIPKLQAEKNDLHTGDVLKINCEGRNKEFTIKVISKDAIFGSQYMGFKRIVITEEDYQELTGGNLSFYTLLYNVNCQDQKEFLKEFRENNFEIISMVDRSTIKMCYFLDTLISAILIVVSICLILISFLILRFTIVFTLQEDYKEIGIMKAIGIESIGIKKIYLIKYLMISLAGAGIGFFTSFPFGDMLLSQSMENMIYMDNKNNAGINVLCCLLVVATVLLFCFASMSKVNKFTAMEAIRRGKNGERYKTKNLLKLSKRSKMSPAFYMACNDVLSNVKKYLAMAAVFCIGTLLILLPLKAIHTLEDKNIIRTFGMQPSDLVINTGKEEEFILKKDRNFILSNMQEIEDELKSQGLEAKVWIENNYLTACYGNDPKEKVNYFISQQMGKEEDDYDTLEGTVPLLPNEIMVTQKTADELSIEIGDSVFLQYEDRDQEFIVTGTFQTMMNMGNGFRVSGNADIPYQFLSGCFAMQAQIDSTLPEEEIIEKVQKIFPDYKVSGSSEYVKNLSGGTLNQMDGLILLITLTVILINVLITILTMKTLMAGERGEIAMLKSIGFADKTIKGWQSIRILLILTFCVILGTILSYFLAPVTIGPIFGIMGASNIRFATNPLEAYILYPGLLLAATGITAYLCSFEIRKVDLKEINTIE